MKKSCKIYYIMCLALYHIDMDINNEMRKYLDKAVSTQIIRLFVFKGFQWVYNLIFKG